MLYIGHIPILLLLPLSAWAAPMCSLRPPPSSAAAASASTPTSNPTGGVSNNNGSGPTFNRTDDFVATTWYAGWHAQYFPPEKLSWEKYTSATYAFATTTEDPGAVGNLDAENDALLRRFVSLAHQNNVKALLTIGGWTGSAFFSLNVGSDANRTTFVQTMVKLVNEYQLDGLDFDWEYPGKAGDDCNIISPNDSANFLTFLQQLRKTPELANRTISAATSVLPFAGPDGNPMSDVSEFAAVLDHVAIMNYDVWGSWSKTVGPNAPLNDSCDPNGQGSAVSAVKAWTDAGFPANQLVLGVAAYGHSFQVDSSAALGASSVKAADGTLTLQANPSFAATQPKGDSWDAFSPAGVSSCGKPTPAGFSGVFNFWGLTEGGFLDVAGNPAAGMGYRFDECSQTPYVYNPSTQVMVSFDNAQSFAAKGQFINEAGLLGFAMWEAAGDSNDILLDAISGAMGIEQSRS
ncbi:glycoside hydrolase [Cristinia sonorae]|uniref:Glycoside hydrolase n=1 Tax=Cristinia sonorae TaxID=1940300 RepID=A0A8K0XRI3_9AGAR|nr:glycoside hydrolase [Cristinia sonorae]